MMRARIDNREPVNLATPSIVITAALKVCPANVAVCCFAVVAFPTPGSSYLGILGLAIAYLLGDIPFGYLLVKLTTGRDVRASGSGNIGATNVLRTTGRAAGIATLLLDIGKGYLAVWIAGRLSDQGVMAMSVATLAVMAGHAYPV